MFFSAFILAILAPAAQAHVSSSTPITVTGHQWAPFVSPMGEPFRAHTATDDTLADWFSQADRNHDGVLTPDEMVADAERFFTKLDTDHDGQIDPDELAQYEYDIAPEIQVMSRTKRAPGQPPPIAKASDDEGGDMGASHRRDRRHELGEEAYSSLGLGGALQGAARYSLLNLPEPVAAADADFNRVISLEEFRAAAIARFHILDTARHGTLVLAQLEALPHSARIGGKRPKRDDKALDARIGNALPPGD
jgi:hypothetical protein